MCSEEHLRYAGCLCEYKAWRKCEIAKAHDEAEMAANKLAIIEGRPQDVKHTGSPCTKHLEYDDQPYNGPCPNCRQGKDPELPGEVGEGKVMPGQTGKHVSDEWDGTHGTPENHA